ncbi:hypothetical protein WJX75_002394 [Coccomyxa subellipsoidea]|uniref:Secreted protein n=1 Tax=Coccomyxa subellipsoidea TaxID=248742 RepID=A0ABR2YWG1_9CHLO
MLHIECALTSIAVLVVTSNSSGEHVASHRMLKLLEFLLLLRISNGDPEDHTDPEWPTESKMYGIASGSPFIESAAAVKANA